MAGFLCVLLELFFSLRSKGSARGRKAAKEQAKPAAKKNAGCVEQPVIHINGAATPKRDKFDANREKECQKEKF